MISKERWCLGAREENTHVVIARKAAKSQGSLGYGWSPLSATALLRHLRDRRRRVSRRLDSGVAAPGDGNRRSTARLGRAVSDSWRLVEAKLDVLVTAGMAAVCYVASGGIGADGN